MQELLQQFNALQNVVQTGMSRIKSEHERQQTLREKNLDIACNALEELAMQQEREIDQLIEREDNIADEEVHFAFFVQCI